LSAGAKGEKWVALRQLVLRQAVPELQVAKSFPVQVTQLKEDTVRYTASSPAPSEKLWLTIPLLLQIGVTSDMDKFHRS
jgi:hypothetical protein